MLAQTYFPPKLLTALWWLSVVRRLVLSAKLLRHIESDSCGWSSELREREEILAANWGCFDAGRFYACSRHTLIWPIMFHALDEHVYDAFHRQMRRTFLFNLASYCLNWWCVDIVVHGPKISLPHWCSLEKFETEQLDWISGTRQASRLQLWQY